MECGWLRKKKEWKAHPDKTKDKCVVDFVEEAAKRHPETWNVVMEARAIMEVARKKCACQAHPGKKGVS